MTGREPTSAAWGVECPLCHRRVVTTEAPCECGFRFPRGYENRTTRVLDIEARGISKGDDLFGAGVVTAVWVGGSIQVEELQRNDEALREKHAPEHPLRIRSRRAREVFEELAARV